MNGDLAGTLLFTAVSPNKLFVTQIYINGKIRWRYSRPTNTSAGGVYSKNTTLDKLSTAIQYNSSAYLADGSIVLCGSDRNIATNREVALITHLDQNGNYLDENRFSVGSGMLSKNTKIISCIKSGNKIFADAVVIGQSSYDLKIFSFSEPMHINLLAAQHLSDDLLPGEHKNSKMIDKISKFSMKSPISYWGARGSSYSSGDGKYVIFHLTDNTNSKICILNLHINSLTCAGVSGSSFLFIPEFNTDQIYIYSISKARTLINIFGPNLERPSQISLSQGGPKIIWGGFVQHDNSLVIYGESGFGLLVKPIIEHSDINMKILRSRYIDVSNEKPGPFVQVAARLAPSEYAIATPVVNDRPDAPSTRGHSSGCDITIFSTQR